MSVRSFFYNRVYVPFRDDRFEDGISGAASYRTAQTAHGFRRVYDGIVRVLDGIVSSGRELGERVDLRNRYRVQLARLDITVQYQAARGILDRDLAEGIKAALREVSTALQRGEVEKAVRAAESLRLALDAVLAYQIVGGRRREEEEEWL
ncbi:MAG: hypothetical protein ACPL3C_03660 [Pyrobaculum sp.]